ncbi:MAG TPA: hypothetical protein PLS81_00870 [Deltaproteobacteria bacterium]|nr:hypothetical protein [Deltaproteobacteria bacterium]HPP81076.1 hypothetical protein [Deltaproteobacteria bacterium]
MAKRTTYIISVLAAITVIAVAALVFSGPGHPEKARKGDPAHGIAAPGILGAPGVSPDAMLEEEYVRELRKYYGPTISKKSTQASLFFLRNQLAGLGKGGAPGLFERILKRAFPANAKDILETIAKLDLYEKWLVDNRRMLLSLPPEQRLEVLWRKRTELFGPEAREMFSGEMLAVEARTARVRETLDALDEAADTPMDDRLELYEDVLRQTYENTPEAFILQQKELLARVFFSIDSVQDELRRMDPVARQQEINRIRRKMGMSEEEIAARTKRDQDRELRWQIGLRYMEEREALESRYTGAELEERLKALRQEYFDDEATTIELEEQQGFFRFKRPRIYGRN